MLYRPQGHPFRESICGGNHRRDRSLHGHDPADVAECNRSPHVLREVERAVSKSVPILVYKMEEVALSKSMEYFLMTHQWLNAGSNDGFDDILAGLQNLTGGTQTARSDIAAAAAFSGRNAENVKKSRKRWPIAAAALVLAAVLAVSCIYLRVKNGSASAAMHSVDVEVGDTVSFGSYNGEDILWRILKISDDGSQAVLVSADILSMKAFDADESGKYNWENAGLEGYGVRPALTVDLKIVTFRE